MDSPPSTGVSVSSCSTRYTLFLYIASMVLRRLLLVERDLPRTLRDGPGLRGDNPAGRLRYTRQPGRALLDVCGHRLTERGELADDGQQIRRRGLPAPIGK